VTAVNVEGTVLRARVAPGSKSDRDAVILRTPDGDYVLRVQGGHPFADPRLDALVGKRIRAEGELSASTLLMRTWDLL
jgi:hypothetical protein